MIIGKLNSSKELLVLLLFQVSKLFCNAPPTDSIYIKDLSDSLGIRVLSVFKSTAIHLTDNERNTEVSYAPISGIALGGGFVYKWLSFNLAFKIPGSEILKKSRKSSGVDLRIYGNGRVFGFDAIFGAFQGLNLYNSSGLSFDMASSDMFRSDLSTGRASFSGYFNLNPTKFSLRAFRLQNERQLKSAGAPIIGFDMSAISVKSTQGLPVLHPILIPENARELFFGDLLHFHDFGSISIGLNGGYTHTFTVREKWFLTLGTNSGLGVNSATYFYSDESSETINHFSIFISGRFAVGYNSDKYYFGLTLLSEKNIIGIKPQNVNFEQGEVRMMFVKRFYLAPKFMNKLSRTRVAKWVGISPKKLEELKE